MSKQVHWQLPFGNIDGTKDYRIDIYDDPARSADGGQSWPVQLEEAASPFVTDEDNSEDILKAVRSQTAMINIVREDLHHIPSIVPVGALDRPVVVVRIWDSGQESVEWQGFLSCDSYQQAYNNRVTIGSLVVNSVLEAMRSKVAVQSEVAPRFAGLMSVFSVIEYAINRMVEHMGRPIYKDIYFPKRSSDFLSKKVDTHFLIDLLEEQQDKFGDTVYTTEGKDLYSILEDICTTIGWVCREQGDALYFQDTIGGDFNCIHYTLNGGVFVLAEEEPLSVEDMQHLQYEDTDHTIYISQGKRKVTVKANKQELTPFELPECPYGRLEGRYCNTYVVEGSSTEAARIMTMLNMGDTAHSNIEYGYHHVDFWRRDTEEYGVTYLGEESSSQAMREAFPNIPAPTATDLHLDVHAGACMVKYNISSDEQKKGLENDMVDALYCTLMPFMEPSTVLSENKKPIFKITSEKVFTFTTGYVHLSAEFIIGALGRANSANRPFYTKVTSPKSESLRAETSIAMYLKVGDKYWDDNTRGWIRTPTAFVIRLQDLEGVLPSNWDASMYVPYKDGMFFPVGQNGLSGKIEFGLFGESSNLYYDTGGWPHETLNTVNTIIFKNINIDVVYKNTMFLPKDGSNQYTRRTGSNYKDELEVTVPFASYNGNHHRTNILFNDDDTPAETINYTREGEDYDERPEVMMVENMKRYYSVPRKRITLKVKPIGWPNPLLIIADYNGKLYLPLSESREWREDKSTITCFEMTE